MPVVTLLLIGACLWHFHRATTEDDEACGSAQGVGAARLIAIPTGWVSI
jgi:hypothetical protein